MKKALEKIEEIAKSEFSKGALSCHDWDHVRRVYNLAVIIGKKEKADLNVVKAAVLLHDIKRYEQMAGGGKICHAIEGAKEAEKILRDLGLENDFIKNVKHSIEAHRFRNKTSPQTIEAKVLSDADKLDALGAIGIGRAFQFSGKIGSRLHPRNKKEALSSADHGKEDSLYREYMVKLRHLKARMFTKTGKELARERTVYMKEFLKRLDWEIKGKF